MKKILLFLFLLPLSAQAASLDELAEQIGQCLDDVTRYDEGSRLLQQAFATKGVEQQPVYPQLLFLQAYYHVNIGSFTQAKQQFLHLLTLLPSSAFPELSISVPQALGVCYRRESLNDSALYYYDQALLAAREQNDLEWQAGINLNIGILHYNLDHPAEAEQFLDRAIALLQQVDDPYTELCALQVNAGVKLKLKKLQEARQNIEPAYLLALESESPDWQLRCISTMLYVYDGLPLPDSALVALQRGDALLPQLPPQSITAVGYYTARGSHYMGAQQWQQAAADLQRAVDSEAGGG